MIILSFLGLPFDAYLQKVILLISLILYDFLFIFILMKINIYVDFFFIFLKLPVKSTKIIAIIIYWLIDFEYRCRPIVS